MGLTGAQNETFTSTWYDIRDGAKADNEFRDKTVRPNEMWQTDFTFR